MANPPVSSSGAVLTRFDGLGGETSPRRTASSNRVSS